MPAVDITPERLKGYPEHARALVIKNAELIGKLPLPFASLLLREAIHYDWKFPLERREIESDFAFLGSLDLNKFDALMKPFRGIQLPPELASGHWLTDPTGFSEKLSAHLWASHQIDGFRSAAVTYMDSRTRALPAKPPVVSRFTLVLLGDASAQPHPHLFRKLRPHGTYFTNLDPRNQLPASLKMLAARASAHPEPFAHWYIDGGQPVATPDGVVSLSYSGLARARSLLQRELKTSFETQVGSEQMRSRLARIEPADLGMTGKGEAAVLDRFALSLLTEGSGTQIYSTTFVQWAVREASRRAQPLTMFARFRPRQRERPMQELLLEAQRIPNLDPDGSLVDADMGAYYAWLSQDRLPGAEASSFIAVHEGNPRAIAIGPGIPKGKTSEEKVSLSDLVSGIE